MKSKIAAPGMALLASLAVLLWCAEARALDVETVWQDTLAIDFGAISHNNLAWTWVEEVGVVIAAATPASLCLYDIHGEPLPGWPVQFLPSSTEGFIMRGPRMGDMNGDGYPEIAVRLGFLEEPQRSVVYTFQGSVIANLYREEPVLEYYTAGSPIFVDLDGDGDDELMRSSSDSLRVYEDTTGAAFPGFPWSTNEPVGSTLQPVLVGVGPNWHHDDVVVVWGTDTQIHARVLGQQDELPGWPVSHPELVVGYSYPALISTETEWYLGTVGWDSVHVWTSDGSPQPGYPRVNQAISVPIPGELVVADFFEDGEPELVYHPFRQRVFAYDLSGHRVPGYPVTLSFRPGGGGNSSYPIFLHDSANDTAVMLVADYYEATQLYAYRADRLLEGFPRNYHPPHGHDTSFYTELALVPVNRDTLYLLRLERSIGILACHRLTGAEGEFDTLGWSMSGFNAGGNRLYGTEGILSAPEEEEPAAPLRLKVHPPVPNPFNSSTSIRVELPPGYRGPLTFRVHDLLGRRIATVRRRAFQGSVARFRWDGRDGEGAALPSGVYLFSISTSSSTVHRKAVYLR